MAATAPTRSHKSEYQESQLKNNTRSARKTTHFGGSGLPYLSFVYSTNDLHGQFSQTRSPSRARKEADDEESFSDKASIRSSRSLQSIRSHFSPKLKLRNILRRSTYPAVTEMVEMEFSARDNHRSRSSTNQSSSRRTSRRRPTSKTEERPASPKAASTDSKPLPASPQRERAELRCQPCYYFAAHHCNGWVLGGLHGDACENCAAAGYFGAS